MISATYRRDYDGEFIISHTKWVNGKKEQQREWIENPIQNQHISGRAACIGSNVDRPQFDYTRLQKHRGGLLASKKLQTYGVGAIALEMRLDFTVDSHIENLKPLIDNKYYVDNVVYTTSKNCILNPGDFYLIPNRPRLHDMALPPYLAAFDGHNEIFLLGYLKDTQSDHQAWVDNLLDVFAAYSSTKFFLIGERTNMFDCWFDYGNVDSFNYRDFVGYCDI
jgi:hypothetical protein